MSPPDGTYELEIDASRAAGHHLATIWWGRGSTRDHALLPFEVADAIRAGRFDDSLYFIGLTWPYGVIRWGIGVLGSAMLPIDVALTILEDCAPPMPAGLAAEITAAIGRAA